MTKTEVLSKLFTCAEKYNKTLLNTDLLFIVGNREDELKPFSVSFRARHFQHLTGLNTPTIKSVDFFNRCLKKRISPNDIKINRDGTTVLKLEVLPHLMNKNLSANMLADFAGNNLKLYTEKIVGNVNACIGFVKDSKTELFVPNTVLRQDIRDITTNIKRIVATFQKTKSEEKYSNLVYTAKGINIDDITKCENFKDFF